MKTPIVSMMALLALFAVACQQAPQTSQTEQPAAPAAAAPTPAPAPPAAAPAPEPAVAVAKAPSPGKTTTAAPKPAPAKPTQVAAQPATPPPPPAPVVREVEIPAGTPLSIRLDQGLSTDENKAGDNFTASLVNPVSVDGKEVLPKGTRFNGHITEANSSGRLKGTGILSITLDSFELNGKSYEFPSSTNTTTTKGHAKRNIGMIAGGAGLGAVIGALAGKGKGAAIGSAAGAAAGTATAAATGKQEADLPAETVVEFSTKSSVRVKQ